MSGILMVQSEMGKSSDILNTEQALDHVLNYHDNVRDLDGSIRDG